MSGSTTPASSLDISRMPVSRPRDFLDGRFGHLDRGGGPRHVLDLPLDGAEQQGQRLHRLAQIVAGGGEELRFGVIGPLGFGLGEREGQFGLFALGDVHAQAAHEAPPRPIAVSEFVDEPPTDAAVGIWRGFDNFDRSFRGEDREVVFPEFFGVGAWPQIEIRLAYGVLRPQLETPQQIFTQENEEALFVLEPGDKGAVLQKRLQPLFTGHQRILGLLALGDVAGGAVAIQGPAAVVAHDAPGYQKPTVIAAPVAKARFTDAPLEAFPFAPGPFEIVGMGPGEPVLGAHRHQLFGGVAEVRLARAADELQAVGLQVHAPDHVLAIVQHRSQPRFALAQRRFRPLALGDIHHHANGVRGAPLPVDLPMSANFNPAHFIVRSQYAVFGDILVTALDHFPQARVGRRQVFRQHASGPCVIARRDRTRFITQDAVMFVIPDAGIGRQIPFPGGHAPGAERQPQPLLLFAQGFFGALALGDVADDLRGADDLARSVHERGNRQGYIEPAAILRHARSLIMVDQFAPPEPRQYFALFVDQVSRNEACDRLADHLLDAIAEKARRSGVPTGDLAVERLAENCVR